MWVGSLTVCEAKPNASSRGRPAATPPSAKASMAKNMYAGPLPLKIIEMFKKLCT